MFKQALFNFIASYLTSETATLINKFRELNGNEKADKLKAMFQGGFELLKEVTDKTKTKADDTIVKIGLDALAQSE
jgi:hypothetical protein